MVYGKYLGSYGSLNPSNAGSYGEIATGYEISSGRIGATTSPETANQVSEVMLRLNEGTKVVELSTKPEVLEMTPQEQFKEIGRIAKLAGMTPTAHAPIVDPAGFGGGREGGASWSEATRRDAEKYLLETTKRLLDANPQGNMNITFHASSMPAIEWQSVMNGKEKQVVPITQHFVNVSDGSVGPLKREEVFKPEAGMEMKYSSPMEQVDKINRLRWDQDMMRLIDARRVVDINFPNVDVPEKKMEEAKERAIEEERKQREYELISNETALQQYARSRNISEEEYMEKRNELLENHEKKVKAEKERISGMFDERLKERKEQIRSASKYYDQMQNEMESIYDRLQKDVMNRQKSLREMKGKEREETQKDIDNMKKILTNISKEWERAVPELKELEKKGRKYDLSPEEVYKINVEMFEKKKELIDKTIPELDEMRRVSPQKIWVPLEDFAKDKASETFSNIAFKMYKDCEDTGKKAPIIAIENWEPNMAFSSADKLRDLINESREKFVAKAVDSGMAKEKAVETAEKLIGATWDVAHLNLIRKEGRGEKESVKEMERQTKLIAPYIKKTHLVDNFGFSDAHIPLGMGNVPKAKLMKILQENEVAGPMISEAFQFPRHFKTSPHIYELEALGAPLNYPGLGGPSVGEAISLYGSPFTGYGNFLPEQHFAMYGGGFSGLPWELGGKVGGKASQFSGTPME